MPTPAHASGRGLGRALSPRHARTVTRIAIGIAGHCSKTHEQKAHMKHLAMIYDKYQDKP